jgi:hypothetical protein
MSHLWFAQDEPKFPEQDEPVLLLGTCTLIDAVRAAVGEESFTDILGVLVPALDAVGLTLLSVLAQLCRSDSASLLQRTA